MKITRTDILQKWTKDWRTLKAWRRDLSEVVVEFVDKVHPQRLGTCWAHQQRLVVYRGPSICSELDTVLHELAHAATIGDNHGALWQKIYSDAIQEVTRIPIPSAVHNYQLLCHAGEVAVKSWWVSSGNDFLWKLVRQA